MPKRNNKHIAVLFKAEVRSFDTQYLAGCERVFLDDAHFLNQRELLKGAYIAAQCKIVSNRNAFCMHHIPYPHTFLDMGEQLIQKIPIFKKLLHNVYKIILFFVQVWYAGMFVIKEFSTKFYYVIEVPLVGLFYPKKTTLIYHNFYANLGYIFRILYFVQKDAHCIKYAFVSQNLLDQFLKRYPIIRQNRCYVLRNAVYPEKIDVTDKCVDKISFIFLSAWVHAKGIYLIPKIIRAVNKKYLNRVQFIIGGSVNLWSLPNGIYKKYKGVENMINNLATAFPNVKILGPIQHSQVPTLLQSSTFCLLPSINDEQNSLLAKESLASGTPVIAFDVGGNREIISHNGNGYLIQKRNVADFIQCVQKLIKNFHINTYTSMSLRAIKDTKKYSVAKRHQELLSILYA